MTTRTCTRTNTTPRMRRAEEKAAYYAAMRGAKLLDSRYGPGWVKRVKARTVKGMDTLTQVQSLLADGGWRAQGDEARLLGTQDIYGAHYGFCPGSVYATDTAVLNRAWKKVVTRRHYLRDLRRRRKMGLTPGTRVTSTMSYAGTEAAL